MMTHSYNHGLVGFSVLIGVLTCYLMLDLAGRVKATRSWAHWAWLVGGATTAGFGMWSMHLVGLLAFRLPVAVSYDWPAVLASLLVSILSCGAALYVVSRPQVQAASILTGSIIIGCGVAATHYTCMAAMRTAAVFQFNLFLIALSILLAAVFSITAIWLALYFLTDIAGGGWKRIAWATQLGLVMSLVHYTGMLSVGFIPSVRLIDLSHSLSISSLGASSIAICTLIILDLAIWRSTLDRRLAAQALELQSSGSFRQIADNLQLVLALSNADLSKFLFVSSAYRQIWGRSVESLYVDSLSFLEGVHPDDRDRLKEALERLVKGEPIWGLECRVVRPDGSTCWVLCRGFPVRDAQGQIVRLVGSAQEITERKRAEEERRKSDELLRIAFAQTAVGFSLTDVNGRFLKVNQAFCNLTGYSEEELYLRDFQSITHKEDLPANLQGMHRLLAGEIDGFVNQKRYVSKSSELVWVQNSVAAIPGKNGVPSGFVALTEDITDRKRAEDRLRESEDRYRDLVEHSTDLICTHDLQGILLSVNEAPLRILGYSQQEVLNRPLRDFVTEETRPHCDAYLAQIQRDGFATGLLPFLSKSGEVKLWEFNNSLRKEGVSSPIVRGIAHDVTEQKRAEIALRKSEEKFSKAFRSSPVEMVITTLEEGRFLDVNESFERNIGYCREEVLGRTSLDLGLWVEPADRAAIVADIKKSGRVVNREIQIRAKSGEIGIKLYSAELLRISEEQCLLAVSEDITARKRAEENLRRLSGQLLRLHDEERGQIARDLHDTTGQGLVALATLLGHIHLTIPSSNRKSHELVSECEGLTNQCLREVRTLSYVLFPPMLERAGITSAIRHYVSGYVERTGIEVELAVSPCFTRMPRKIELALFRVLQESLVNIQRHSGSHTARINLSRKPRLVLLEVSDKGCGMHRSEGKESNTFQPIVGVGIPTMMERVKDIGGRLDIESSDTGTTIRVTIPTND